MRAKHFLLLALISYGCATNQESTSEPVTYEREKLATSDRGMVAAAHPLATEAGALMLELGGNAADAAVATAFVIAVVEPTMNGIGGRNQIFVRLSDGSFQGYNGMTEVPQSFVPDEDPPNNGHRVIATPGVVAALMRLHQEHGSLSLDEIMEPAITYAREGFVLLPGEAARHKAGLKDIKNDPGFRQSMLKGDSTYAAGDTLMQPALAATLERIRDTNGRDFYEGETAAKIVQDMKANQGFVTAEDLKNYQALDARYVTTSYRGYQIHSIPAPAGGGLVVKSLNIMEQFDLAAMSDAEWGSVVAQSLALALQSMESDYKEEDLDLVQSKSWAEEMAKSIIAPESSTSMGSASDFPNSQLLASHTDWTGDTWGQESHHTTHFSTADCQGMLVSITQTVGPLFGSKVITPDLGFVYASTMGAYLSGSDQEPGSRPRTTIAPTVVTKNGETVMVLGAAGGLRILSGIVQTISRYVDQGKSLEEAVAAPRVHPETGYEGGEFQAELMKFSAEFTPTNGWLAADSLYWQANGFEITAIERYGAFSRIHAIARDENGQWIGMADLDWEGTSEGPSDSSCDQ